MSESLVFPAIILLISATALLSWFIARWLNGRLARFKSIIIAGFVPVILSTLALYIWHFVERSAYRASGSQEGFMSPLLFLLYGFLYFVIMIAVDLVAAASARKPK